MKSYLNKTVFILLIALKSQIIPSTEEKESDKKINWSKVVNITSIAGLSLCNFILLQKINSLNRKLTNQNCETFNLVGRINRSIIAIEQRTESMKAYINKVGPDFEEGLEKFAEREN